MNDSKTRFSQTESQTQKENQTLKNENAVEILKRKQNNKNILFSNLDQNIKVCKTFLKNIIFSLQAEILPVKYFELNVKVVFSLMIFLYPRLCWLKNFMSHRGH